MSALATVDATEVVPASTGQRPAHLSEVRPWDRIAFRMPAPAGGAAEDEEVPSLVWPRAIASDLPDPGPWCGALVRTFVEVLLGSRPPAQLSRWLTAELYGTLARRAALAHAQRTDARRVRVLRVHTCAVDDAVLEASVVIHDGRRVRAAAIRIEIHRGRWRATALEIA